MKDDFDSVFLTDFVRLDLIEGELIFPKAAGR